MITEMIIIMMKMKAQDPKTTINTTHIVSKHTQCVCEQKHVIPKHSVCDQSTAQSTKHRTHDRSWVLPLLSVSVVCVAVKLCKLDFNWTEVTE